MTLRATVRADLERRGLVAGADDSPTMLREKLNDLYVADVRLLRERQRAGEIPLREYASAVERLRESYPLLSLPLELWTE